MVQQNRHHFHYHFQLSFSLHVSSQLELLPPHHHHPSNHAIYSLQAARSELHHPMLQ